MPPSVQRFNQFIATLISEERYDEDEGVWKFADGSHCSVCLSSALRVAQQFKGSVMGYWSKSNPSAIIGRELCEGHDFAFISKRWIVDYWAFRVACVLSKPVLDLQLAQDQFLAKRFFGDSKAWEALPV